MQIVSEKVVDSKGKYLGDDPSKFANITNKCLQLITTLETGQDYKIVKKGEIA